MTVSFSIFYGTHSDRQQQVGIAHPTELKAEMNRIEEEWHQLKTHEIAGRMFEDEYDLALAVIEGMETRSVKGQYTLELLS